LATFSYRTFGKPPRMIIALCRIILPGRDSWR
jgi:hypothetical protein